GATVVVGWQGEQPDGRHLRRRELPRSLASGIPVSLCDVKLPHDLIPVGMRYDEPRREMTMLPCRAEPGPRGRIEMLRYRVKDIEQTHENWVRCVARRGVPVTAALVQANNRLFEPGREPLPATTLFTFDKHIPDRDAWLDQMARRVFRLKTEEPQNDDEAEVAQLTRDERARMYRRVELPSSFTGGPTVYAADL